VPGVGGEDGQGGGGSRRSMSEEESEDQTFMASSRRIHRIPLNTGDIFRKNGGVILG